MATPSTPVVRGGDSPDGGPELDFLERRASDAVVRVRSVVEAVRSVGAFTLGNENSNAVVTGVARPRRRPEGANGGKDNDDAGTRLESGRLCPELISAGVPTDGGDDDGAEGERDGGGEADRRRAVRCALLPALGELADSYDALDSALTSAESAASSPDDSADPPRDGPVGRLRAPGERGGKNQKRKPPPPRGLLSVADYTDVACLLEFAVSASILPHLERGVLPPAPLRAKVLPRSMAGRLPRRALLWGSAVKSASRGSKTAVSSASDAKRKADELMTAAEELRMTAEALGVVILSDRFRPMLLPRHAADVLAAVFQAERFETAAAASLKKSGISGSNGEISCVSRRPNRVISAEMLDLFLGKTKMTTAPLTPPQPPYDGIAPVDPRTRARAYRTLLSGGTSNAPPWLRRRVGALLTAMASVDAELRPVVDAFVSDASSMPGSDTAAAAARLGRVLCAPKLSSEEETRAAGGASKEGYYARLFQQVAALLDEAWFAGSNGAAAAAETDPRTDAGVLTAWAVLSNTPLPVLRQHFLPHLVRGLIPSKDAAEDGADVHERTLVHRSIRRICLLLSRAPTAAGEDGTVGKVCELLLSHLDWADMLTDGERGAETAGSVTVLGQLLRIAASGGDNVALHSACVEDSVWAARMSVHFVLTGRSARRRGKGNSACDETKGTETGDGAPPRAGNDELWRSKAAAVALVRAVCTNGLDGAGYRFRRRSAMESAAASENETMDEVVLEQISGQEADAVMRGLVEDMERRARIVVDRMIAPLCQPSASGKGNEPAGESLRTVDETAASSSSTANSADGGIIRANLPNSFFHLLLLIYLGGVDGDAVTSSRLLPTSLLRDADGALLASMVLLPLCCERCPSEALLLWTDSGEEGGESSGGGGGVLDLIRLVLHCAASKFGLGADISTGMRDVSTAPSDDRCSFAVCDVGVYDALCSSNHANSAKNSTGQTVQKEQTGASSLLSDAENVLSVSSLVLSLLVAMLELGTSRRTEGEEESLSAMMTLLRSLAAPPNHDQAPQCPTSSVANLTDAASVSAAKAEMAEMASHAMALISARSAEGLSTSSTVEVDPSGSATARKMLAERIKGAEQDLMSDQPPIRARGVVELRHIAQGFLSDSNDPAPTLEDRPLIVEIDPVSYDSAGDDDERMDRPALAEDLARISIGALSDSESYVYLAAVQTLVAITDFCPAVIIPRLGVALGIGRLGSRKPPAVQTVQEDAFLSLSLSQRTKLAEALMFTIRRRGSGIYIHGPALLDMMMYGCRSTVSKNDGGDNTTEQTSAQDVQQQTEEYFRISKMSGEAVDEGDCDDFSEERMLRVNTGGPVFDREESDVVRASCVLVVSELVSVLPPSVICRHCASLMRLAIETLRLESSRPVRRSAATLCRELYSSVLRQSEATDNLENAEFSVAVQMILSKEDALHAALQRCVSADDVDHGGNVAVTGKHRLYDPATVARCEEALRARESGEDLGIFAAASLVAASRERDNRDPTTQAVLRKLREL